jgi:hypothetical protein
MLSAIVLVGLMASTALAKPHGHGHNHLFAAHHAKRSVVTECEVKWETLVVTEYIDELSTVWITPGVTPSTSAATSPTPGQFFEGSSTEARQPAPTTVSVPESSAAPPAPDTPPPQAPAPAPTTSVWVAPPAPTTSAPPVQPPASGGADNGGSGANKFTGDLTYYQLGLGACGWDDSGKDYNSNIVAISYLMMGEASNNNPMCGKTISISAGGKTITAIIRDKCMGCAVDAIDGM